MKLYQIKRRYNRWVHRALVRSVAKFKFDRSQLVEDGYSSQYGQDRYINEFVFKNKAGGVFVDIGANDGRTFSNTLFFEKQLNWRGVAIEPLPSAFQKLQQNRDCICLQCCVGARTEAVEFLSIKGHSEMLSGVFDQYEKSHLDRVYKSTATHGDTIEKIMVQSMRLSTILEEHDLLEVDYLSLDTEGGELEILKSIDFSKISVKAISVENNYDDPRIYRLLKKQGFRLDAVAGDEIYVQN